MMKFVQTLLLKNILALTILHSCQGHKHVSDCNRRILGYVIKNVYSKSSNTGKNSHKDLI